MKFKAENGQIIEAQDEIQAIAFRQAGLTEVKETKKQEEIE